MSQEATVVEISELTADYEILGELGRGGMAIVYLARDRQLGREVAIKVIHAAAGSDAETIARQLVEARTVAQLQHPNVVAIYAVKRLSTLGLALVMQYIPGRTLERAMREDGAFTPERTESVLTDIAAALAYAHARGVIHRDIKPDNIFLNDETGRALLSDFGIALSAEHSGQSVTADVIVGTPAYMSPEQIDGLELDGRSDVFSLGLIGYEMLAGVRPWLDESISDVMYRQKAEPLTPLDEVRNDTPDRLRAAIERSVAKDRDDRWSSASEFLSAMTDDEWVPDDNPPGATLSGANRIAAHLAARSVATPGSSSAPLETVQYRRDGMATPRRGVPVVKAHDRRGPMRLAAMVLPPLLVAAAAAVVFVRPDLVPVLSARPRAVADSVARVQAATIAALRDSTAQAAAAAADAARRSADSAISVATSAADSNAARRLATIKDSLTKAAAEAQKLAPAPVALVVAAAAHPAPPPPPPVVTLAPIHPAPVPTVVGGGSHTCALGTDGNVSCWGGNDYGQLGGGGTDRVAGPVRVNSDQPFAQIAAGISHSCGVTKTGAAYCWGSNEFGQVGDSAGRVQRMPLRVVGGHTFRSVATGTSHSCGLETSGEVWCWGHNQFGQLGNGSTQDQSKPVRVESSAHFVVLTAGWNHSCALDAVGHAFCWGQNLAGQLGDGTTILRTVPTPVSTDLLFRAIAAGGSHTCALTTDNQTYCWGQNRAGQLGIDDNQPHTLPTRIGGAVTTFASITAGGVHSCALTEAGDAYCWGRNSYGQLGDGTTMDRTTPVRVAGDLSFATIQANGAHTCATTSAAVTYCWGNNGDGQLGDGTTIDRPQPVPVSGAK